MSKKHDELWVEYVEELRVAKSIAESWWEEMIAKDPGKDRKTAIRNLRRRWPDGPASHPRVIAVILKYYRACKVLNEQEADEDDIVYPHVLISDWLMGEETDDLDEFLIDLTYLPIGLDLDDNLI